MGVRGGVHRLERATGGRVVIVEGRLLSCRAITAPSAVVEAGSVMHVVGGWLPLPPSSAWRGDHGVGAGVGEAAGAGVRKGVGDGRGDGVGLGVGLAEHEPQS